MIFIEKSIIISVFSLHCFIIFCLFIYFLNIFCCFAKYTIKIFKKFKICYNKKSSVESVYNTPFHRRFYSRHIIFSFLFLFHTDLFSQFAFCSCNQPFYIGFVTVKSRQCVEKDQAENCPLSRIIDQCLNRKRCRQTKR